MPSSRAKQSLLYAVALAGIAQGATVLTPSQASASETATCCDYSSDCPGTQECFEPKPEHAYCSPEKLHYCRKR
jgi:hypothetical protein